MKTPNTSNTPAPRPKRPLLKRPLAWLNALLLLGLAAFWLFFRPLPTVGGGEPESAAAASLRARVFAAVSREDEQGFTRIDMARPGGWLLAFKETPQSLETYQSQNLIRPTASRRAVVLQPFGTLSDRDARLLEDLREYAEVFFQLPTRVASAVPLPSASEAKMRGSQFHAGSLMSRTLAPRVAKDAALTFGIANEDLWTENLNFVFGQAHAEAGLGVLSLARLRPSFWHRKPSAGDETLILKRACRLLSHEAGHALGLWHCVFYKCVMNGSNSLSESDSQPLFLCPVCEPKLRWNIGFDRERRELNLLSFYQKHGFKEEAAWQTERLARWRKARRPS